MATINMLEETANYLLNHCFVLGGVEDQRAKYLYVQDHLDEVRAVFAPLGYSVLLYPAPLQAAALVNGHEGSQARLLKYESILLLVLRLLYLQKRESLAANADEVLVTKFPLRRTGKPHQGYSTPPDTGRQCNCLLQCHHIRTHHHR